MSVPHGTTFSIIYLDANNENWGCEEVLIHEINPGHTWRNIKTNIC